ncbi:glycosyltransferase family 4 protein [Paenibacillus sp. GYB003]|uniref:glycosyltransferase family 4 protein n=1 Tax=Paenibacillus sp. GYB003 TaxID=2994392 RepID=UPI002F963D06
MRSTGERRRSKRTASAAKAAKRRKRKPPLRGRKVRLRKRRAAARKLSGRLRKRRWRLARGKKRFRKSRLKARRRRRKATAPIEKTEEVDIEPVDTKTEEPGYAKGINIIGFIRAEMGIGESSRLAARAVSRTDIPFDILNFPVTSIRMDDFTWRHKEVQDPQYKVNIIHTNADTLRSVHHHFGASLFDRRFNIGYWHWELPDFPEEFCDGFHFVSEVWAPSNFVAEAIAKKSPVPVIRIPHGVEVNPPDDVGRGTFGLPEDRFLFFSMYDTHSYQRRKNPQGAILAFKQAFDPQDTSVGLVVKLNHSHANPSDLDEIRKLVKGYENIYVIDRVMSRKEVDGLLNCTDCFVSLHRSEGFGLGLAEAMYLGKPVIGTYWSGNTDFMNATNSCIVDYSIVSVGSDWGPYKGYQSWAEPDLGHAAHHMREIRYNTDFRNSIAFNGMQHIRTYFSPEVVGEMMKGRLSELGLL